MIHEQAIISPKAKIGKNVTIGPWTYIGDDVEIGDDCQISSHVVIKGPTKIGKGNRVFQFATLGEECQDLKYAGEPTELIVGDNNTFRECCTIHRGTIQDNSVTIIGNDNLFMAYSHVAHDCIVGNRCILANSVSIAGHVHVGDFAIIGGMCGVHQFVKIGAHSFVAASSLVLKDIPPYVMASGNSASPFGLNSEGLKRRGFEKDAILAIKRAYRSLYRKGLTVEQALTEVDEMAKTYQEVELFAEFIKSSSRGIIR